MLINTNNLNFKQFATNIPISDSEYFDIISNVQGTAKTGHDFNEVLKASLRYLTFNCFYNLNDSEYNLTHFKAVLDTINKKEQYGFKPYFLEPYNGFFDYKKCKYLKESYAFVQFAYYMNSIDLKNTPFFKYTSHFSTTGTKLPDDNYTGDLSYLHKEYSKIIEPNGKTRYLTALNRHFNGAMFMLLNELELPTTHFNNKIDNFREYNALVQTPREWRKYFPFDLTEYDIKSAFPSFIDEIINTNVGANVYELIMQTYNVDRDNAKMLFNKWLNSTKYKTKEEFFNFFEPIYKDKAKQLSELLSNKDKPFWKVMFEWEHKAITLFLFANKIKRYTRLHDAIFIVDNEYNAPLRMTDLNFVKFGSKEYKQQTLDIKLNTSKRLYKGYHSAIVKHSEMNYIYERLFNENIESVNVGDFTIYQEYFYCYKGNFNVGINGFFQDSEFVYYNESWLLEKIQKLANIVVKLNDMSYSNLESYLRLVLENILNAGIWSFNIDNLLNYIISDIQEPELTLCDYTFHSEKSVSMVLFQKYYYEALAKAKFIFQCKSIYGLVEKSFSNNDKRFFINPKDIFSDKNYKAKNKTFVDLIERFNKANGFETIGKALKIKELLKSGQKSHNPIKKSIYRVVNKLSETELRIQRREVQLLKEWNNTIQDSQTIKDILEFLNSVIFEVNNVEVKEKLNETIKEKNVKVIQLKIQTNRNEEFIPFAEQWQNLSKVFDTPEEFEQRMEQSVLNISETDAMQRSIEFYFDWVKFKFKPSQMKINQIKVYLKDYYNGLREIETEKKTYKLSSHNISIKVA